MMSQKMEEIPHRSGQKWGVLDEIAGFSHFFSKFEFFYRQEISPKKYLFWGSGGGRPGPKKTAVPLYFLPKCTKIRKEIFPPPIILKNCKGAVKMKVLVINAGSSSLKYQLI